MATTPRALPMTSREILLVALALVLAFAFLGARGLYETTEGRYAESAREMIETGDWLVPRLDYEPHWSKPPLTYWAIAGGMVLLGENEWGARLAPALSYLAIVWVVFGLGAAMWGRRTAFASALVYATAPLAVLGASVVSTDPILAMWQALAALAYWRALTHPEPGASGGAIVLFWLALGLGFLTKGPPALLTLLAVLVYHSWRRAKHRPAPRLASALGLSLFAVVGLGWYVAVAVREEGLLTHLLRHEVVDRVASAGFHRNSAWYHAILIILLPFVFGLGGWLGFVPRIWRAWRRAVDGSSWWRELAGRDAALFCAIWIVAPLAVLAVSRSRLPLYVLPFLPAPALLIGRGLVAQGMLSRRPYAPYVVALLTAALLICGKATAGRYDSASNIRPVYRHLVAMAGESPSIYAYELSQEYGLMFYLKGRMIRVSRRPDQDWASIDRRELMARLSDPGRTQRAYAVARSRADELDEALSGAGLRHVSVSVSSYTIFAVDPASVHR